MVRKKVLFIVTRFFWPTNSGRKVVLYNYCKGLYDLHHCDINLYVFPEDYQDIQKFKENKPYFIKDIIISEKVSYKTKIFNLFNKTMIKKWPIQCSLYFSDKNGLSIRKYIKDESIEIVIVDMVRLSEYIDYFKDIVKTTVIDFDDLLSKRYSRQLQELSLNRGNIAGVYANRLPRFINKIIGNKVLKQYVLTYESRLTKNYEILISNKYDYSIFISEIEASEFRMTKTKSSVLCITMGIHSDYLKIEKRDYKKNNYISYMGNYYVAANQDSIQTICQYILPLILEKNPSVILKAIGPCPDNIKKQLSSEHVHFTDEVNDIATELLETNVFLGYIKYGTGIKTKVLEAAAVGVPVVTNSVGAEGLNFINGKEIIIADQYDEIADNVLTLLTNSDKANILVENARSKLKEEYVWDKILLKFKDIFE